MSIYTIEPERLIDAVAKKLKEFPDIKPPEGSKFWKTAHFKELAPIDPDFWWIRCASILRKVKKHGPIGVNRLRKHYGGKNRKGSSLRHSARGAGKIIRVALQQLENAKLLEKTTQDGREVSSEGISLLERTAHDLMRKK